jgi:prophage regulatory protein
MKPIRMTAIGHRRDSDSRVAHAPKEAAIERRDMPLYVPPLRLLRFTAVSERTGLSRSTIWRLERRGDFPRHRRISVNAVAWVEDELVAWIRAKADSTV